MATKAKKPVEKQTATKTKVTRISASDTTTPKKAVEKKSVKQQKTSKPAVEKTKKAKRESGTLISYFKGAWYELRQVKWPSRKATWSLTGAMLAFTAFFAVVILLLDALFQYLFKLMLG